MSVCTFFGHRDCPTTVEPMLHQVLVKLIEERHVDTFYVGRQGAFDALVRTELQALATRYPHIRYAVVLERVPGKREQFATPAYADTMLPEGIETVHPRYAIVWRNQWMLKRADYVVTYITHSWGGAAKFAEKAICQKKNVINLGRQTN